MAAQAGVLFPDLVRGNGGLDVQQRACSSLIPSLSRDHSIPSTWDSVDRFPDGKLLVGYFSGKAPATSMLW